MEEKHISDEIAKAERRYREIQATKRLNRKKVFKQTVRKFRDLVIDTANMGKNVVLLIKERIDPREFDIWRGMSAGSQAQGSWQNIKGDRAEVVVKDLIRKRLTDKGLVVKRKIHGKVEELKIKDGRKFILGSEPDIGIYKEGLIQLAMEIKGGIDPAGVLERFGAALKSLRRGKQENSKSITILIMQGVSLTSKVKEEINKAGEVIDHFFTIEEVTTNEVKRKRLFKILKI